MKTAYFIFYSVFVLSIPNVVRAGESSLKNVPAGWTAESPRDEIRPHFSYDSKGGPNRTGCFVMNATGKSENMGQWTRTLPVTGGRHFAFRVLRKADGIESPRRNTMVRITWQDDQGNLVSMGSGNHLSLKTSTYQLSQTASLDPSAKGSEQSEIVTAWLKKARYEFPADQNTAVKDWTEVADVYLVPPTATQAQVELCLRWVSEGEVRWSEVSFAEVTPPKARKVRLATINYGKRKRRDPNLSVLDLCRQFEDLIAEAARQHADLVCLPEELTYLGTGKEVEDAAEPIPGPCSDYFGELAKKHDLYIVAGLVEKEGPHVYNTAVLLGPEGTVVGKYRKVCLTRGESVNGYTAGREFPVFETRFGKVGVMICWDLMFPEPARNLSNRGADVIALPIAGGDPILARARAIENQIYLVTCSNGGHGLETGVFGYDGSLLGEATDPKGSVCVVEVDLNQRQYWHWLGNLKNEIPRARP